jgi:type I restriction enzyme R subunit
MAAGLSRDDFPDDPSEDFQRPVRVVAAAGLAGPFIAFETDPESGRKIKKIWRYQQFRAVNKAVARVAEGKLKTT